MPTVKADYEAVFIFSTTLGEEGIEAIKSKFSSLIADNAELGVIDEWGKRRLAYLINDEAEGYYVLYNFVGPPEFPAELDRVSKITDGVLRSLIVRKEEKKNGKEIKASTETTENTGSNEASESTENKETAE